MKFIDRLAAYFIRMNQKLKRWRGAVSVLSALVVFCVTYSMILPAITLDRETAEAEPGIEIAAEENNSSESGTVFEETVPEESVAAEEEAEEPEADEEPVADEESESAGDGSAQDDASQAEEEQQEDTEDVSGDVSSGDTSVVASTVEAAASSTEAATEESAAAVPESNVQGAEETAADESTQEIQLITEDTQLIYQGTDYIVYADFGEPAKLPVGVQLDVREITKEHDPEEYEEYYNKALGEMQGRYDENTTLSFARFYDITFKYEGKEIEPSGDVKVRIEYKEAVEVPSETNVDAVHFDKTNENVEIMESVIDNVTDTKIDAVEFKSDQFSVYGVVGTETIITKVITASGDTYEISVTYGPEAEIPKDAVLFAEEITDSETYDKYLHQAESALTDDNTQFEISFARFFDIEIRANGEKIEPKAPVEVQIKNASAPNIEEDGCMNIVHFAEEGTEVISDLSISDDGKEITYSQNGFSVTGEVAGTFSGNNWPSSQAGDYVLVVYSGNGGPYYAVNSSGGLVEVEYNAETGRVTFPDDVATTTADLDDYWWTYYVSGGNHCLTSVANTNNKIYPTQTEGGSALSNSTNSPGANQGYIYRGGQYNRYCVAINDAGTSLISRRVTYSGNSYTYPSNAAHFIFVNNFEEDVTGAYGTAESTILTDSSKTLRMAEVTTSDESLIDFEGFTWRSSNPSIATVSTDPDTDAPVATAVNVGTTRIIGTRINGDGELDEVVWTVTVKDRTSNSIVFLHQPQDNANFANQDYIRPHDGYGDTEPTNYVKFVVALADEDGNIILYNGKPNVELPAGSVVPDRYEFELDSTGVFVIGEDTLSGISIPGYSYAGTYAYFGWYNNTDLENMAVVSEFKNLGSVSSRYPNYYSVLGFKTSRGNPQYQDYSQTAFGNRGYGYYAYNPTGVLMIVLQPVSEDIAYRTSYHNDYVPGGTARTNIVDTTRARMIRGEWIPEEYRYDWYGETIMTTKTGADLVSPADGYEFVGWFDAVDAEGNGTGNQIVGQTEEGYYYALKDGEKIIIRQNNDFYAKWQLVRGTITINKEIVGELTEAELNGLKEALTFTVTDDTTGEAITKSGSDITWNQKEGSVDVSGLSAATTYTVTESNAEIANYDVTTVITGGTNIKVSKTGAVTVSVQNTYVKKVATIKVIKMKSGTAEKLPDATFDLYRPAEEGDTETVTINVNGTETSVIFVQSISVGEEGEAQVADLPVGAYYLVETSPPDGYNLLDTVIGFELSTSGIALHTQDHVSAEGFDLSVYNDPGITLPHTGGSGTSLYTLSGLILIIASALMYGFRMRRRERRLK